jgi:hypothetical protein
MKRTEVLAALPCFVCGDLPPEVHEVVRAAVEAHPELQAKVAELRASQAISRAQGESGRTRAPIRPGPPAAVGLGLGVFGVCFLAMMALFFNGSDQFVEAWGRAEHLFSQGRSRFEPTDRPGNLEQRFLEMGLSPALAQVRPETPGLRLLGGLAFPNGPEGMVDWDSPDGPGRSIGAAYEADGQRFGWVKVHGFTGTLPADGVIVVGGISFHRIQAPSAYQGVAWVEASNLQVFLGEEPAESLARRAGKAFGHRP